MSGDSGHGKLSDQGMGNCSLRWSLTILKTGSERNACMYGCVLRRSYYKRNAAMRWNVPWEFFRTQG